MKSVYYAMFESKICYTSLVWAQNTNSVARIHLLQKKFPRIMFFLSKNSNPDPLFKLCKILKSFKKAALQNCFFISKSYSKAYCLLFLITRPNFGSDHTLMILDGQILVILKYSYYTKTYGSKAMFLN